jgi:glutamine synthetase
LAEFTSEKNVKLFGRHNIFTPAEMDSRYTILLEEYSKTINIEALTMLNLAKREISPAVVTYTKEVVDTLAAKKAIGAAIDVTADTELAEKLSKLFADLLKGIDNLEATLENKDDSSHQAEANYFCEKVIPAMNQLREAADALEEIVAKKYWPFPTYEDILFYV